MSVRRCRTIRISFGCRFQDIVYGDGVYRECIFNPLAQYNSIEEIEANYTWPSVDWYDFSGIPGQLVGKEHPFPANSWARSSTRCVAAAPSRF